LKATGALLNKIRSLHASKTSLRNKASELDRVEVRACADFDDRFDTFWEDLKRNNPRTLLAVRSREFLHWHFKHAVIGKRLWIATVANGSQMTAYAIFYKTSNAKTGIKQAKLVDYQALNGTTDMLGAFISWAVERCRSEGIHILEHTGRWLGKNEFFENVAPYRRQLPSWQYFYHVNNPRLKARLTDKSAWAPSLFDGDATL
jgi:hypothetical protein